MINAEGNHLVHKINGHTTTDLTDEHPEAPTEGVLALQMHSGFTQEIHFKDIQLKALKRKPAAAKQPAANGGAETPAARKAPSESRRPAKQDPSPQWIWRRGKLKDGDVVFFRKSRSAQGRAEEGGDHRVVRQRDGAVRQRHARRAEHRVEPAGLCRRRRSSLTAGHNAIAVRGLNTNGPAGLLLKLEVELGDGSAR